MNTEDCYLYISNNEVEAEDAYDQFFRKLEERFYKNKVHDFFADRNEKRYVVIETIENGGRNAVHIFKGAESFSSRWSKGFTFDFIRGLGWLDGHTANELKMRMRVIVKDHGVLNSEG